MAANGGQLGLCTDTRLYAVCLPAPHHQGPVYSFPHFADEKMRAGVDQLLVGGASQDQNPA